MNSDAFRARGSSFSAFVRPLRVYLGEREQMLMVSRFTDDKKMSSNNPLFPATSNCPPARADSHPGFDRRGHALIAGVRRSLWRGQRWRPMPRRGRSLNRRVEMAPVPRRRIEDRRAGPYARAATA